MSNNLRLRCTLCGKSVSTGVHDRTIVRAILVCPECIEIGRVIFPEPTTTNTVTESKERSS